MICNRLTINIVGVDTDQDQSPAPMVMMMSGGGDVAEVFHELHTFGAFSLPHYCIFVGSSQFADIEF
jgi:hypothetical protein